MAEYREVSYYFVLNGLQDGEDGMFAVTTSGQQQKDGWYYLVGGWSEGHGPFASRDEAKVNAERAFGKRPSLPSEWAKVGYYCLEGGWVPKVGNDLDYYDRDGAKQQGVVVSVTDKEIVIDGWRHIKVRETFKLRKGRT